MAIQISREHAEEVVNLHALLVELRLATWNAGNREVSDALQRAARELEHPSVTGPLNQVGVEHFHAIRV